VCRCTQPLLLPPLLYCSQDATARIAALTDELKSLEARQGELKAQLYAKFGKSINLEDD